MGGGAGRAEGRDVRMQRRAFSDPVRRRYVACLQHEVSARVRSAAGCELPHTVRRPKGMLYRMPSKVCRECGSESPSKTLPAMPAARAQARNKARGSGSKVTFARIIVTPARRWGLRKSDTSASLGKGRYMLLLD